MGEKFNIVVADDNDALREQAEGVLDCAASGVPGLDVSVTDVCDGVFAFDHVIGHGADLWLSDIKMPRLSGPESVREIFRNSGAERQVPCVAFMTCGDFSDSDRELLAGLMEDPRVLGMFQKPLDLNSVGALLRIASVRKGLLGAGVLSEDPVVCEAVETVHSLTRQVCESNRIPLSPRFLPNGR